MERELALEIARVTEVAALNSAKWMGKGSKNEADEAATSAMRKMLDTVNMIGTVVIGEGEMDEAPMLYIGEKLGNGKGPFVDIAVDPLEGTNIVAKGMPNATTVIAVAPEGTLLHAPDMYMEKIAAGPRAKGKVSLSLSVRENIEAVAKANGKEISDVVVTVLDRERHEQLIEEIRETGARVKLIQDGDVIAALNTCFQETGVDILFGSGGAPEGILAAVAIKCMGGEFQGRLLPVNEEQKRRCEKMGILDTSQILTLDELVSGNDAVFAASGVTDGELLKGVHFIGGNKATTHTLVMRVATGTIRFIEAIHDLTKKEF